MTQTNTSANMYTFIGDTMQIVYYPSAPGPLTPGGSPGGQIQYQGIEGNRTFTGQEIQTQQCPLGTLLTVTLKFNNDAGGLNLTLLLPPVYLDGDQPQLFDTIAIKTSSRGFVVGPGAGLTYEVFCLQGTASIVFLPLAEKQ